MGLFLVLRIFTMNEEQLWRVLRPWFAFKGQQRMVPLVNNGRWSGRPRAVLEEPTCLHTPPPSAIPRQLTKPKPKFMLRLIFWSSRIAAILPYKYDKEVEKLKLSKLSTVYSIITIISLFLQWCFMTEELHTYYVQEGNVLSGLEPIILTILNFSLMLLALVRSSQLHVIISILNNLDAELSPLGSGPCMWLCAIPSILSVVACTADIATSLEESLLFLDTLMYTPYYWCVIGASLVETQFNSASFALRYWFWILNQRLKTLRRRAPGAYLRLEALRLTHGRLHLAAAELETAFGPQLLLACTICFVGTVLNAYFGVNGYYDYDQGKLGSASYTMQNMQWIWALLYLTRVSVICFGTSQLTLEAARCSRLVHALNDIRLEDKLKEEISMFSMQVSSTKIEFTAFGILPLDFSLLFGIVSSTTTYLLILIQYRPK